MSPRTSTRTEACDANDAILKLQRAETFLEVAELITDETDGDYLSAAAAIVVLAGIAASDAACCKALGRRSRGANHHDAEDVLKQIQGGGDDAAKALSRLINLKDEAHYGFHAIGKKDLKQAIRQAEKLVEFAQGIVKWGRPAWAIHQRS